MEAALTSERVRMKEKESEEQDMSTEELKSVLRRERIRMSRMAGDLAVLRSNAVQSQAEAEVNEEGRINCLLAHLDGLQQEKGRIILELEREEEMVSGKCVHVHILSLSSCPGSSAFLTVSGSYLSTTLLEIGAYS